MTPVAVPPTNGVEALSLEDKKEDKKPDLEVEVADDDESEAEAEGGEGASAGEKKKKKKKKREYGLSCAYAIY
jgi:hypothetical protein